MPGPPVPYHVARALSPTPCTVCDSDGYESIVSIAARLDQQHEDVMRRLNELPNVLLESMKLRSFVPKEQAPELVEPSDVAIEQVDVTDSATDVEPSQRTATVTFPENSGKQTSDPSRHPEDHVPIKTWHCSDLKQANLKALHLAQNWEAKGLTRSNTFCKEQNPAVHKMADAEAEPEDVGGWTPGVALDTASGFLVVLNAISMSLEMELRGSATAWQLGIGPERSFGNTSETVFSVIEKTFCVIFLLEIAYRIHLTGKQFFSIWNTLDAAVVIISTIEEFVFKSQGVHIPDTKLLRVLRLCKLVKAVRVMRVMKFVHPLRVLLVSILSSIGSLVWSMILLSVIQGVAAVGITQIVADFVSDESNDLELRRQVFHFFGRWSNSMLTMFEITLAPGRWAAPGRLLIFQVDAVYAIFFIAYVWGVSFAIIRVIAAVFLQHTMSAVSKDEDLVYQAHLKKHDKDVNKIKEIFEDTDKDGGGGLCPKEFQALFQNPRMKVWIQDFGLNVSEVSGLFRLMDDGDGLITFEEFLSGMLRLRGGAKSVDLASLLYENKKVISKIEALRADLGLAGTASASPDSLNAQ